VLEDRSRGAGLRDERDHPPLAPALAPQDVHLEDRMSTTPHPARLHVLLAQGAPRGLVFRRGPSNEVATYAWDRREDRFLLGQWLRGRIYARRSDLSPDGRHLIYFAMDGRWEEGRLGAWTAVSRAPYLKALALFAKDDCWHGGGLWLRDRVYWLNDGYGHRAVETTDEIDRDPRHVPVEDFGGECPGVYYHRLRRDGWTMRKVASDAPEDVDAIFDKPLGHGWLLRKACHAQTDPEPGRGVYWDEHGLLHEPTGERAHYPHWEWADLDRHRLVWAEGGCLHAAPMREGGPGEAKLLHDFNDARFEAVAAPYDGSASS